MPSTTSQIESLLFIANRPLPVKRLMELCDATKEEVAEALESITARYDAEGCGLRLVHSGHDVQMTTSPDNATLIQDFLKDETTGELTKPSLETLTIIAYRGPITKPELEQVRGVNCSLIIRNLLMRGLVEVEGDPQELTSKFRVTIDFLRFLGISGVEELPEYEKLRSHENVIRAMESAAKPAGEAPAEGAPAGQAVVDAVMTEEGGEGSLAEEATEAIEAVAGESEAPASEEPREE